MKSLPRAASFLVNLLSRTTQSPLSSSLSTRFPKLRSVNGFPHDKMASAGLRLVQIQETGETDPKLCVSLNNEDRVIDITKLDPSIPRDMRSFLEGGETSIASAFRCVEKAMADGIGIVDKSNFVLKAPIYNPTKVICIGMNYVDHCTEQNVPVPEEPVVFSKFPSSITEPNGAVLIPPISNVRCTGSDVSFCNNNGCDDVGSSELV